MRVTFDEKSYIIDGKRVWLVCGEMHYFRTPRKLWRDRFLKAKNNGINCISTYMAWNVHEPKMDEYCFEGDYDVEEYIKLAGELGLYIILRPGPYICSEWDFGGFPPYLNTIDGMKFREYNEPFMERYSKYFEKILPQLSKHDVEHGGNIILIQNENEHIMPNADGRTDYFKHISKCYREAGFKVPIIHCNRMFEGDYGDGLVECVNTWDDPTGDIKAIRDIQKAPVLITELWVGGCDAWNRPFAKISGADVFKKLVEIVGNHAQYTYYMWHGGTNFGFYGGRLQYAHDYHMITSYDLDAPLNEGGIMGEKYQVTGLVNKFCMSFQEALSDMTTISITKDDRCTMFELVGDKGGFTCLVENNDNNLSLASYEYGGYKLDLSKYKSTILPKELEIDDDLVINSANVMPVLNNDKMIVFYGMVGETASIKINSKLYQLEISNTAQYIKIGDYVVAVVSDEVAKLLDLGIKGQVVTDVMLGAQEDDELLPEVEFEKTSVPKLEYEKIEFPKSFDELENYYGYGWYKTVINVDEPTSYNLHMPYCEDRCTVFVNGERAGVWGVFEDASIEFVSVLLSVGENTIDLFVDNMGRMTHSCYLGEAKGIYGDIFDAKKLELEFVSKGEVYETEKPQLKDFLPEFSRKKAYSNRYKFELNSVVDVHFMAELKTPVKVYVNNNYLGFYQNPFSGFVDIIIPKEVVNCCENSLEIIYYTEEVGITGISLISLNNVVFGANKAHDWEFARWTEQKDINIEIKKDYPCWYTAKFGKVDNNRSLFIKFDSINKGQLYLNGNNVGRIYSGIPQDTYYLPECWLCENNVLEYFSDNGEFNGNVVLQRDREWKELGNFTLDVL